MKILNKIPKESTTQFIAIQKNNSKIFTQDYSSLPDYFSILNKPIKWSNLYELFIEKIKFDTNIKYGTSITTNKLIDPKLAEWLPIKILVAEDNIVNQKLIVNILKKFGYICDIVANGNETIEALTRNKYDLILMDIQMPELDGIETTKQIIERYPEDTSRPHIVAMTAHNETSEGIKCRNVGMEGYLNKPIDIKELKNILEFWGKKINKK